MGLVFAAPGNRSVRGKPTHNKITGTGDARKRIKDSIKNGLHF